MASSCGITSVQHPTQECAHHLTAQSHLQSTMGRRHHALGLHAVMAPPPACRSAPAIPAWTCFAVVFSNLTYINDILQQILCEAPGVQHCWEGVRHGSAGAS